MRRLKLVAQIFLFLSIVSFTFAGVAQTPTMDAMHVNLVTRAKDVTESTRTERGHTQSEELPEWSERPSTAGHLHSREMTTAASSSSGSLSVAEDPKSRKFFTEELNRKMKEYLILGAIAGMFTGVANGIQKEIFGTVSPGAYVSTSPPYPTHLLPTLEWRGGHEPILTIVYLSQTVGRSVEPLNEHPQDQEDLVSRSLSNMGDEDLRMLSILSRRMLNGLY
jgi:hypothetical protein